MNQSISEMRCCGCGCGCERVLLKRDYDIDIVTFDFFGMSHPGVAQGSMNEVAYNYQHQLT